MPTQSRNVRRLGTAAVLVVAVGVAMSTQTASGLGARQAQAHQTVSHPTTSDQSSSSLKANPGPAQAAPASSDPVTVLTGKVESGHPSCFGGIDIDASGVVQIRYAGGTASCIADRTSSVLSAMPASDRPAVRYLPVKYSLDLLQAKMSTLTKQVKNIEAATGANITGWGVDIPANNISVTIQKDVPGIAESIGSVVGGSEFANVQVQAGENYRASRTNDTAPWWGGDLLFPTANGPLGTCTSGFSMIDFSGVTYNSTAGHCGNGVFKQNTQPYGVTTNINFYDYGPTDAELISTYPNSSAGRLYYQEYNSKSVTSVDNNQNGGDPGICRDGYNTHEVCGGRINNTNLCRKFVDGLTTCNLIEVFASGAPYLIAGDSGGPVYNVQGPGGGNINARGLIVGGFTGNSSIFYYTPIIQVTTYLGASPRLGG